MKTLKYNPPEPYSIKFDELFKSDIMNIVCKQHTSHETLNTPPT